MLAAVRAYADEVRGEIKAKSDTIKAPDHFEDLTGKSLAEIAGWVSYMLKLEPKGRLITVPEDGGTPKRASKDHWMSDDIKTSYMIFLDQLAVRDLIFLMGVKPSQNGFISTRR